MTPSEPLLEGRTRRVLILPSKTPTPISRPNPLQTGNQQTTGLPSFHHLHLGTRSLQGWLSWDQLPRLPLLPTPTGEPTLRRAFWTFSPFNSIHSPLFCVNTLVCESAASTGWGCPRKRQVTPCLFSARGGPPPNSLWVSSPPPTFFFLKPLLLPSFSLQLRWRDIVKLLYRILKAGPLRAFQAPYKPVILWLIFFGFRLVTQNESNSINFQ